MIKHDQMLALVDQHKDLSLRVSAGYTYPPAHADHLADALATLLDRTAKTEADRDYNRRDADHLRNVVDRLNAEIERLRESIQALCENNLTLLHNHTKVSEENATLRTEKHADAEAERDTAWNDAIEAAARAQEFAYRKGVSAEKHPDNIRALKKGNAP